MASLQSLRRKIGSIKNTQKITKAMKMVAAAKLKRAQDRILAARPYAKKMAVVLGSLGSRANRAHHPLLRKAAKVMRIELLVVTSDRGLCGAFNANIVRKAVEFVREKQADGYEVTLSLIGRKARDFFRRRTWPRRQEWVGVFDRLSYEHALDIGGDIVQEFSQGTFDELYIVYNEFKSAIQQRVVVEKLLPIESIEPEGSSLGGYLFEPDEAELLKTLLPKHIEIQTYHALLESSAAELGARMAAMDSATRNAGELIKKLTLYYNKTRQAAITKELMDIVGGAEALR
jgi:F-type H+-transporting ATPase subunit gamma